MFLMLLFCIILLISTETLISIDAQENGFVNCSHPFQCGRIQAQYPFWGMNRGDYCGELGYKLDCQQNVTFLTMISQKYRVLAINNASQTLKIAREDYWDTYCPKQFADTTLDYSYFDYAAGLRNLTLLYDCSSPLTRGIPNIFSQGNCDTGDSEINLFYFTTNVSVSPLIGSCQHRVHVPVSEEAAQGLEQRTTNLTRALNGGFDVRWIKGTDECDPCEESEGVCGRNLTTNQFSCFCQNVTNLGTLKECPDPTQKDNGSNKKPVAVGAALGGAAVAVIFIGFCFYFLVKRRKQVASQSMSKDSPTPLSKGLTTTTTTTTTTTFFSRSTPNSSSTFGLEKGSTYFGAQVFSYVELEEATDNFDSSRELGDGGFGTVYYGLLNDGRAVAVKRLYENNAKRVEQFMNEVEILTRLKHPNLVRLYGCTSRRSRELILVYEYIPNGTVADHLHGKRAKSALLTWPLRLSIAIETADALAYLHASDIIHRDVKTNNILLDNNFQVKVADFGLSRLFPNDVTHVSTAPQGTPGYVDPEYFKCYQLTSKSDVYSFGVVLIELISSKEAVDITRHRHDINLANMAVKKIQNHALHELVDPSIGFEEDFSVRQMMTLVAELAFRCLQEDRDMRPSMEEVLEVLRGIQDEKLNAKKVEEMDIIEDDVGLLKSLPPPLSPETEVTDKSIQVRTF